MRITDIKGIAPANYKNGMKFANKYRYRDIAIMIGTFIWETVWLIVLFWLLVPNLFTVVILMVIVPIIAILMIQPMPNYHNNLEYFMLLIKFHFKTKRYTNLVIRKNSRLNKKNSRSNDLLEKRGG